MRWSVSSCGSGDLLSHGDASLVVEKRQCLCEVLSKRSRMMLLIVLIRIRKTEIKVTSWYVVSWPHANAREDCISQVTLALENEVGGTRGQEVTIFHVNV